MKLAKRQPILKWMKNNVTAKHHGNCFFYAATIAILFDLTLKKGPPPHKGKGEFKHDTAHFWAEDKNNNIYDPTHTQLEKDYPYKGKTVNPKKNVDYIIDDPLFKKLPEKDQKAIKKLLPMSKHSAYRTPGRELTEEEIQQREKEEPQEDFFSILKTHFPELYQIHEEFPFTNWSELRAATEPFPSVTAILDTKYGQAQLHAAVLNERRGQFSWPEEFGSLSLNLRGIFKTQKPELYTLYFWFHNPSHINQLYRAIEKLMKIT